MRPLIEYELNEEVFLSGWSLGAMGVTHGLKPFRWSIEPEPTQ